MAQHPLIEASGFIDAGASPASSDLEYVRAAATEFFHRGGEFVPPAALAPELTLTDGELDALRRVGLAPGPETRARAERARKESLYVFFSVFKSALPTSTVAAMLGVNASRIRQRIKDRTLLALSDGGESRLPAIQFHDQRELPGLRLVLPALPAGTSVLEAVSWLATPNADLAGLNAEDEPREPISPREYLLRTGDGAAVAELATSLRAD